MKQDAPMMKKDETNDSSERHADHMTPRTLILAGRSDLTKHVGQRVTVTGALSREMAETTPNDRETLTIAVLKVVAKSCS
jgi:hypothetical protein